MPPRNTLNDSKRPSESPTRYSTKSLLRTMAILAFLYVCLLAYLHFQSQADLKQVFGGSAGLSALKYPDRIQAYRIDMLPESIRWTDAGLSDYPILKGPIAVSQPDTQTLVATLNDRSSYFWNARKACIPQPGVRLDFIRGNDRLSVLLCFECDMLDTYLNDKPVSGQNFDYARAALVRVAHSLFPDDPTIQTLTEDHSTASPKKQE